MDMTQQVTIANVGERTANGQRGAFTVYEVFDTAGITWQCKKPVYDQAAALVGYTVTIAGAVKQNGNFTNYYLNEIHGAPAAPAAPAPPQPAPVLAAPPSPIAAPVPAAGFVPPVAGRADEQKTLSIHRQCAAKVAAQISAGPEAFWKNVGELVHYFQTGTKPGEALAAEIVAAFPGATVNVTADVARGVESGAVYTVPVPAGVQADDDIPF